MSVNCCECQKSSETDKDGVRNWPAVFSSAYDKEQWEIWMCPGCWGSGKRPSDHKYFQQLKPELFFKRPLFEKVFAKIFPKDGVFCGYCHIPLKECGCEFPSSIISKRTLTKEEFEKQYPNFETFQ